MDSQGDAVALGPASTASKYIHAKSDRADYESRSGSPYDRTTGVCRDEISEDAYPYHHNDGQAAWVSHSSHSP